MPKGISLHIGLNAVDPNHYQDENGQPWSGNLSGCEFDAGDMRSLAKKAGFTDLPLLLTKNATADAVKKAIVDVSTKLSSGDIFLLTYSGHGGQVPDLNHDEKKLPSGLKDRMDETWVLFDRELIDDELYELWAKFKPGVRIFVLSDSCHSGTVIRAMLTGIPTGTRVRRMPQAVANGTFKKNRALYTKLQKDHPTAENSNVRASGILISGCQDNQTSLDGDRNGLFTETLKKVWKGGQFKGSYAAFRARIASHMPESQTPNYFVVGKQNAPFEAQNPFSI